MATGQLATVATIAEQGAQNPNAGFAGKGLAKEDDIVHGLKSRIHDRMPVTTARARSMLKGTLKLSYDCPKTSMYSASTSVVPSDARLFVVQSSIRSSRKAIFLSSSSEP